MDWINGAHSIGFSVEVVDLVLGVATEDFDEVSNTMYLKFIWSLILSRLLFYGYQGIWIPGLEIAVEDTEFLVPNWRTYLTKLDEKWQTLASLFCLLRSFKTMSSVWLELRPKWPVQVKVVKIMILTRHGKCNTNSDHKNRS